MKKLATLVAALSLLIGTSCFAWEVPTWGHSMPGFNSYISTPVAVTYGVTSWSNQSYLPATGFIKSSTSFGSYKATFTGTSGYAKGSTSVTYSKNGNSITVRSSASASATSR